MKKKKTTVSAEERSLAELLGMKEEAVADAQREVYDHPENFSPISLLTELEKALSEVDQRLAGSDGEKEELYLRKIRILCDLAKTFHPLSAYGIGMLRKARACRREWEAAGSPLITSVTRENSAAFTGVLSEDLMDDILAGRFRCIGAIRSREGKHYGAGAIVYYVEDDPVTEQPVLRIIWLYVTEEFRETGVADHLMAELLLAAYELGIRYMTAAFPADGNMDVLKGKLLSSWNFKIEDGITPDTVIRVRDITNYTKVKKYSRKARALKEIYGGVKSVSVKRTLARFRRYEYLALDKLPEGYIDPDISCFFGEEDRIQAIMLAHRLSPGMVRAEFMGTMPGEEAYLKNLACQFIEEAVKISEDDTLLTIPIDNPEMAEFLEDICGTQMGQYLLDGFLKPPASGEDITSEAVEEMKRLHGQDISSLN